MENKKFDIKDFLQDANHTVMTTYPRIVKAELLHKRKSMSDTLIKLIWRVDASFSALASLQRQANQKQAASREKRAPSGNPFC